MKNTILNVFKKSFVRNVIIVAFGTAGAQVVTMGLSPIITRLYGPEAFGILGTFQAIIQIIVPISALTYPVAIVLPKVDQDARGIIRLSLTVTACISFIALLIIILFNNKIVNVFKLKQISSFLYLIPLVIVFAGLVQVAEQWLIRTKQFSINARVTFLQSIITNVSKVGVGLFYPLAVVLVVLQVLANGIKAAMLIISAKKSLDGKHENVEKRKSLRQLAKEYYDFPAYRAPQQFFNGITNGLPTLMLTALFGPASVGFYTIGRTVLRLPTTLIGNSVGDVFYPHITEAYNRNEDVTSLLKKATLSLAGIGVIPFGFVVLFGPTLFSFVFGSDWVIAGEYARWLSLWSYSTFINRPCVKALATFNAQRFHLLYTIINLLVRLFALWFGYFYFQSDLSAILLFGVSGFLLNIGLVYFTLRISRK